MPTTARPPAPRSAADRPAEAPPWLDEEEMAALVADLREIVGRRMELQPGGQRRRRLLSTVLVPGD